MVTKKLITILVVVMLCGVCSVRAGDVDFYSDAIIRPGEVYDIVSVYDTPPVPTVVHMFGGCVITLRNYDSSISNIHNGQIIGSIEVRNSSTVNIHGGDIDLSYLAVSDSATLNIFGGELLSGRPYFTESSTVNIYGYGFNYGSNQLTGFLSDGSSFLFNEIPFDEYSHMNLIVIPEPATLLLFGLWGLLLRKRK